jgi:O-antigen/teichoic acid export membrane protein
VVTIPAVVWRGGFARRALTTGVVVGICVGVLAWLDSGFWISGVVVFVVVGTLYGVWMARRMTRYWPGAQDLTGEERMKVARAVRRGEPVDDDRLSQPVLDYSRGLHEAAETARWLRWVLIVVLVVAVGTAVWDAVYGSWGSLVASAIYLAALVVEVFWMPKWQARLLSNAEEAVRFGRRLTVDDSGGCRWVVGCLGYGDRTIVRTSGC